MASWVISASCTQCGQPQRICPSWSSARSSAWTLGSRMTSQSAMSWFASADSTDEFGQCVVRGAEVRAVAVLEEDPRPDPGSILLKCAGWIGSLRSFALRERARIPSESCCVSAGFVIAGPSIMGPGWSRLPDPTWTGRVGLTNLMMTPTSCRVLSIPAGGPQHPGSDTSPDKPPGRIDRTSLWQSPISPRTHISARRTSRRSATNWTPFAVTSRSRSVPAMRPTSGAPSGSSEPSTSRRGW